MASKYIQKFPIPEGFPDILHDMTREVLRYQPENIIEFCALYFECLQEGKELVYSNMGSKIPCDFQNVIPGSRSSERVKQMDKSNYNEAINNCKKISISKGNEEAVGKSSGFEKKEEEFEKERNNEKIVSSLIDTDEVVMNENQNSFNKTEEDDLKEKDSNDNRKDVKRESNFSKTTMEKKEISNNYVNSLLG